MDIYGERSLKSELKSLAKESNVTVNFYGKLSNKELIEIYEKYKYYVTTSNFEEILNLLWKHCKQVVLFLLKTIQIIKS